MAFITAADVVVGLNPEDIDNSPDGRIGKRTFPTVQFGNAVLHYPAAGVPMPVIGKFGFHFAIKRAYIENPGNGYIYSFDRANHKVRIWLGAARDVITLGANSGGTPSGNVAIPATNAVSAGTPAGNVAIPATNAVTAGTPAGNVAIPATNGESAGVPSGNVAIPATNAVTAGTPAGNLSSNVITFDPHSHSLVIAANTAGNIDADIGANAANLLVANVGGPFVIPGGVAANGGIANATQTGVVNALGLTLYEMATHVHAAPGNVVLAGDALANHTHAAPGNVALVGVVMGTHVHAAPGDVALVGTVMGTHVHAAPGNVALVGTLLANHTHSITGGDAVAEAPLAEMDNTVAPASVTLAMEMVGR